MSEPEKDSTPPDAAEETPEEVEAGSSDYLSESEKDSASPEKTENRVKGRAPAQAEQVELEAIPPAPGQEEDGVKWPEEDSALADGDHDPRARKARLSSSEWWAFMQDDDSRRRLVASRPLDPRPITSGLIDVQEAAQRILQLEERVAAVAAQTRPSEPEKVPGVSRIETPKTRTSRAVIASLVLSALAVVGMGVFIAVILTRQPRPEPMPSQQPTELPLVAWYGDNAQVTLPNYLASEKGTEHVQDLLDAAAEGEALPEDESLERRTRHRRRGEDGAGDDGEKKPSGPYSLHATLKAAGMDAGAMSADNGGSKPTTEPMAAMTAMKPADGSDSTQSTIKMLQAAAMGEMKRPAAMAAETLPQKLSHAQLSKGMRQARSSARRCLKRFGLGYATVRVKLTIRGSTGRVASAKARGRHANTPCGRCVERALKRSRFARFSAATQVVTTSIVAGN